MPSANTSANNPAALVQRAIGRLILPFAAGAIAFLTLTPSGGGESAAVTSIWCLSCGEFGAVDVVLNTLLFVPLGLALTLVGVPSRRVVLTALLTSLGIEALQFAIIPGRDASLSDVLTNTTGGAIGALLALQWRRLFLPGPSEARTLVAVLALMWTGSRLGTAWLLRPSLPDTVWYGQIAPKDVYPADFRGEVLAASIGGLAASSGLMPELHDALRSPTVEVRALVSGAARTPDLASVVSVLDEHRAEVLVLGQSGNSVLFRFRLRSADARFRTPTLRLDGAFPPDSRQPTELTGFRSPGRLSLSASMLGSVNKATIALSPGLGWALLLPFDTGLTPALAEAGTAVLAVAALLLVGYLVGMSLPERAAAAIGAALTLAAAGLLCPSIVFPEATVAASEALAAALGSVLGVLSGAAVRGLRVRRERYHTR